MSQDVLMVSRSSEYFHLDRSYFCLPAIACCMRTRSDLAPTHQLYRVTGKPSGSLSLRPRNNQLIHFFDILHTLRLETAQSGCPRSSIQKCSAADRAGDLFLKPGSFKPKSRDIWKLVINNSRNRSDCSAEPITGIAGFFRRAEGNRFNRHPMLLMTLQYNSYWLP